MHIDQFLNSNQQPLNITYYSPDGFLFFTELYSWDDVVLNLQYCEVIMNLMVPVELPWTLISTIVDQKHALLGTGHKLNVCKTFSVLESSENLTYVQFRLRGM